MRLSSMAVLLALGSASAAMLAPGPAPARNVVIYRCTDAKGALTIQNDVACPKGSRQQRQVVQPAQTMATPVVAAPVQPAPLPRQPAPVAPPKADEAGPGPTVADADRLPPPPLFQCNTFDNDSYLTEDAAPAPRCVRLQTTGIDGSSALGAGEACQMVTDQCQRVPDAAACAAWGTRLKQVEASWRFAPAADKAERQDEFRRVSTILRDTTCGR